LYLNQQIPNKKRKNDSRYEEEIEFSNNWSRFIVLKSSEGCIPLTKLSPFVIEKCIKSCTGDVKNVTKLKSGGLMIECQRRQQPLNLLSLKQIHSIAISSTPHRTLNTSRGVIRYRDEDLDDLSDEEICEELAPQGVIHVKRFISKRNGQTVKLNTFLITFNFPTILSSIRMGLYNDKVSPYVPNPIRCIKCQIFGHGKGQCNGKLKCFKCSEEDHEGFDCNNNAKCSNCGQPHMTSSKDC
jgi:hypothetical protein